MDEQQACQTLLVIFANVLRNKSLDLQVLSPLDVERCGVYEWEKGSIGNCSSNSNTDK
jgi:nucleolar pre-ribosomal-associated protein 1